MFNNKDLLIKNLQIALEERYLKSVETNKLVEQADAILDNMVLCEMSLLHKEETNLPTDIWIDEAGKERSIKHNLPRLKILQDYSNNSNSFNMIPILIDKNPKFLSKANIKLRKSDLKLFFDFIKINYDLLIKLWNKKITLDFFREQYKKPWIDYEPKSLKLISKNEQKIKIEIKQQLDIINNKLKNKKEYFQSKEHKTDYEILQNLHQQLNLIQRKGNI